MKLTAAAVVGLCLMVVMVTATPSKRGLSLHKIEHSLHHIGHEIENGAHHVGHEIENGAHHIGHDFEHLGQELKKIKNIHDVRALACKLYPVTKTLGNAGCSSACVAATSASAGLLSPLCPVACHMVFHEANKLVKC
ncbi:hypothetical protein ACOMHN_061245 [Nucella lapillus]